LPPTSKRRPAIGEVFNFPTPSTETDIPSADKWLSRDDVALLITISDNVETLLDMMAGIWRDPEVVA
jgi:hypothetical protein